MQLRKTSSVIQADVISFSSLEWGKNKREGGWERKNLTEETVADKSLPEKAFFARFEFKKKTSSQNYCDLGINYFHNLQKK